VLSSVWTQTAERADDLVACELYIDPRLSDECVHDSLHTHAAIESCHIHCCDWRRVIADVRSSSDISSAVQYMHIESSSKILGPDVSASVAA
jgi:hypothetical protein